MRFWYTSFHLLQYLLYQEIGGERMADQPDIASLAFQRHPPPLPNPNALFFFLILLHSSFHYSEAFKSEQTQLRALTCLLKKKTECFCCCCLVRCYANLSGATCGKRSDSHLGKSPCYFSKVYIPHEFNGCLSFSKDPSSPAEIKLCVSRETPPTPPKKTRQANKQFCSTFEGWGGGGGAEPLRREAKVPSLLHDISSGKQVKLIKEFIRGWLISWND